MTDTILELDSQLLLWLNSFHSSWSDAFVMAFTGRFIWIPMYAMLLFILLRLYTVQRAWIVVLGVALGIALTDQVCATLIRPMVERLRPSNELNPLSQFVTLVNGYRGGSYGFPSCHAANSFALAAMTAMFVRNKTCIWFIFIWAALNSLSRAYLGVHYPTDLLVGATIGTGCGLLCAWIARMVLGKVYSFRTPGHSEISEMNIYLPVGIRHLGESIGFNTVRINVTVLLPIAGMLTVAVMALRSL